MGSNNHTLLFVDLKKWVMELRHKDLGFHDWLAQLCQVNSSARVVKDPQLYCLRTFRRILFELYDDWHHSKSWSLFLY